MWIEIIGIVATLFILISMCFKTLSFWGSFWLRLLNIVGSIFFVAYGILIPALSTAILNGALILVNGFYLIKLIVDRKKETANPAKTDVEQKG